MKKFKLLSNKKPVNINNPQVKRELTITVSGSCGSGKSRITYLLKNFLREKGFEVEHTNIMDYHSENEFERDMCHNIDEVVSGFVDTRKIIFNERQIQRREMIRDGNERL
jgi:pantothenate kinase-related protein Tda10